MNESWLSLSLSLSESVIMQECTFLKVKKYFIIWILGYSSSFCETFQLHLQITKTTEGSKWKEEKSAHLRIHSYHKAILEYLQ